MAPKKSKGSSSSSAMPIPEEAKARAMYKQLCEKKKWIEGVRADAQNSDLVQYLARTRVLLDKQPEIKEDKEKATFLKVALELYTKLPDGCEQPPGHQQCSLGMLVARAKLLQLVEGELQPEQLLDGLHYLAQLIGRGFTRDGWQKLWFDPRSENLKEEEKSRGSMVAAAAAAAEQLLEAWSVYAKVFLSNVTMKLAQSKDESIRALVDRLPAKATEIKQPWADEATAAKEAGKATKAAEPAKQQDAKKALQQESKREQMQRMQERDLQQRRAGGRDTERTRDMKRSKATQEDQQKQQQLDAARKKEEDAKEDAAKVLDYLEKRLLSSSSSSPEQHMARLQEESRVSLEVLKKTISSLSNRDAKDKDKQELPLELQLCKQQLGDTNPSDNLLKQQLQQLQEKGPSAWMLYCDDTAAAKAGSGGKAPKALYDSWDEFEEHVVNTHLVTAPDSMPLAFPKDEASEQLLSDSYKLKGMLQQRELPLEDAAAEAARQGSCDSSSPWLQAFDSECPLQRFTRTMASLHTEESCGSPANVPGAEDNIRVQTAVGFALLQAARKQVAVDRLQQSRQPGWAVQAYHLLKLLPGTHAEADADPSMYVIFNYWMSKQACREDYRRIVRPHLHPEAAANGSSDAAASFSDGLAEDNVTMLSELHKDGLLSGPLLLAVQLYLNKAVGKGLDLSSSSSGGGSSSKGKGKRQDGGSSSAALDAAAALSVLSQLSERQQVELRLFLLKALHSCHAGLSVYVEFVQQEQQQRKRPQEVPVEVVGAKEKGKDKGEPALVLTQDFYEQACVSAAVPEEHHEACCIKHHTLRLQAEAEGNPYSKFDSSMFEDIACAEEGASSILQADNSIVQRYLLQPARVEQLLEQVQLRVGTREGLKALVDALFAVGKHEHQRKALLLPAEEEAVKRTHWEKAQADMAIAAQLALHRWQLHAMVLNNEEHLSDSNNSQWTRHDLNQRMRGLLQQRNAGAEWVLRMWLDYYSKQLEGLRKDDASLQEQLRALSDAPEKDKAGKGSSKDSPKEREEHLTRKANLVAVAMNSAETTLANVKAALSRVLTEAEGYPDLIRAYHNTETGQANPLVQMLSLMSNELLGPAKPNTNGAAQQLSEALQLSRLSLFDLDVWVMGHALTARRRVLSSMWHNAQTRAVLALSHEALKSHLKEGISKSAELELLAAEEEFKQTQQQQPQQGKAAGKKKKKKGGAAKATGPSLMSRIAGSDSADEDDEEAAAAAAAAKAAAEEEEAARAAAAEEEEEEEEQDDNGWNVKLDLAKLDLTGFQPAQPHSRSRTDSRDKEHAAAAAPAPAAAKPAGRGDAAPAARPASAAARGDRSEAAASAGSGGSVAAGEMDPIVHGKSNATRVCSTCGAFGHGADDCHESFCRVCKKYGHASGDCRNACSDCGKVHADGGRCFKGRCFICNLYGHEQPECPLNGRARRCGRCQRRGHPASDCPGWCRRCEQRGHMQEHCTAKPCATCGKLGHLAGSPECPAEQQSSSSSSRPPAAEPSRAGSGSSRPAASAAAAAGPRRDFRLSNLKLLSRGSGRPRDELMNHIQKCNPAWEHCILLLGSDNGEEKLDLFARLLPADLDQILQSSDPVALLEEVHTWKMRGRAGSLQPVHLLPAGRRVFEDALPPRLRSLLPPNWARCEKFATLASDMEAAAGGKARWGAADRDAFADARERAQWASAEAEAALKDERAAQETKQQARQQQRRQPQAPRQQQQRELERRPSGSGEHPGSGGGGSSSWGPPSQPQLHPAAAAAVQPGPAKVSFAAASQQQVQEQQQGGTAQADAGISMPPALLSEQPGFQYMPAAPYAGVPGQPAPPGQPWPPAAGMAPQQQQQHPDAPVAVRPPLPRQAFAGQLQAWMLWHHEGAKRALYELVADEQLREQLYGVVQRVLDWEVVMHLVAPVTKALAELKSGTQPIDEGLLQLSELVAEVKNGRGPDPPLPVPSPVPQPAPMAALAPHLQRRLAQQPAPAGASTHMLPPHLQHHNAAPQQHTMWQQQQQPAGDDDEDSDDEDGLMNLLTGSGAAAGPSQQQQQPAWGGAAGQQHGASGAGSDFPSLGVERGSGAGMRPTLPDLAHAGLANETGEYNCFLNVVVQCLYSCREFRNQVWEVPAYVAEHPVVVALKKLFMDMQAAEVGWQPGGERSVVNPTALREALDSVTQFKQQEMNDANELLDALYECFKKAQGASPNEPGSRGVLIDGVFGLKLNEAVVCNQPGCGKRTHVIGEHWEHMLVVNTNALTFAAYAIEGASDMGKLLQTLFDQDQKMCDKDVGGCGTAYPPARHCGKAPSVLTLQLVWNQEVASSEIDGALQHIQEHVDITPLYVGGCEDALTTYQLSSAVAYYGQHYMAFVHNTKLHTWLMFDDASVSVVGSWQDVVKKCTAGKIQPSVLFYQRLDLDAAAAAAPQPMPAAHNAPAPVPMGVPAGIAAAAAGPGGAPWAARPPAAAMPGVPPHMAMPPHMQQQQQPLQQPHQLYSQQPVQQQQQQQPMPPGPYSQPPPQQQQLAAPAGSSAGWPAAAAADGSGHGGSWHTVQQPADAGAAWGSAAPAAGAAAPAQQSHAAAGAPPPAEGPPVAHQSPAKASFTGAAGRGGASMAAAAIRGATGQPAGRQGQPGAAPGGGRGSSVPRTTGPPPSAGGRADGPYGGSRGAGRGRS